MKKRIPLYILFMLFLYCLAYIWRPLMFNGISPSYIFPAVVALGLYENEYFGMIFGICFGALAEFGGDGTFGLRIIAFGAVGYTVGYLAENRLNSNLIAEEIISVGGIFLYYICVGIAEAVKGLGDFRLQLLRITLPAVVMTAIITPAVYIVIKLIGTNRKWRRYDERIR